MEAGGVAEMPPPPVNMAPSQARGIRPGLSWAEQSAAVPAPEEGYGEGQLPPGGVPLQPAGPETRVLGSLTPHAEGYWVQPGSNDQPIWGNLDWHTQTPPGGYAQGAYGYDDGYGLLGGEGDAGAGGEQGDPAQPQQEDGQGQG